MKRVVLPMAALARPLVECTECGKCCTYVGVGIDAPSRPRYATDILWYLYHENVYVYVDGEGGWSVHFEARCRNLGHDLLCRVYADRPHICRSFDNRTCETNDPVHHALTFREAGEFLAWLSANKPQGLREDRGRVRPAGPAQAGGWRGRAAPPAAAHGAAGEELRDMADEKPLVGVLMGSASDWEAMKAASESLQRFGVPHECRVLSAHRTPHETAEYAQRPRRAAGSRS